MAKIKVAVGKGHGGKDTGAKAIDGTCEREINANQLKGFMEEIKNYPDIEVLVVNPNNNTIEISERAKIANEWGADYYLSLHNNAYNGEARGFEAIHTIHTARSKGDELARFIADKVKKEIGVGIRRVFSRANSRGDNYYGIVRMTRMPSVIVEGCFIDNSEDYQYVNTLEKQLNFGKVYARAFADFVGAKRVDGIEPWKAEFFDYLGDQGIMSSPEVWKQKESEPMPVWAVTALLAKMHRSLTQPNLTRLTNFSSFNGAHIIKTKPDNIEIKLLGSTLKGHNGINGAYFDVSDSDDPHTIWGIAVNDGKAIGSGSYAHYKGYKRGTCYFTSDGELDIIRVANIEELPSSLTWAISGYQLYDKNASIGKSDFIAEGFKGAFADVWNHTTNRAIIGITDNQVYLIIKPNASWQAAQRLCVDLKLEKAVMLDGGGSAQMSYNGKDLLTGRAISTAILIKQI